jgi:hypothetical protein
MLTIHLTFFRRLNETINLLVQRLSTTKDQSFVEYVINRKLLKRMINGGRLVDRLNGIQMNRVTDRLSWP